MSYNTLRPAPASNLAAIANGSVLTASSLNEYQACMNHLAGRGGVIGNPAGNRISGRIQVPIGVVSKGFNNSFFMGRISKPISLWLNPGYDMLSMFFEVRLNSMKFHAPLNRYVGSTFAIDLVRGGVAYRLQELTWQQLSASQYTLQTGFFRMETPILGLFQTSPIHAEEIYIVLTYDMTEGEDSLIGTLPDGVLSNPTFWNGCSFFSVAAYKNIVPC